MLAMTDENAIAEMIPGAAPSGDLTSDRQKSALADAKVAFDKLSSQQKAGEEPSAKDARAAVDEKHREKAEKKAAKAPKPAKAAKAAVAEPAPEVDAEAEPTAPVKAKPRSAEVDRLRAKLQLAGAPKSAVESLSDEDVREWWKTQEKREADYSSALARASEVEKKTAETAGKPSEPFKGVPTDEPDLDDIASELADQFGEEESGSILKALHALTAPLQAKVASMEAMIGEARKRGVETISKTNRERLSEKLPFLKESDEAWKVLHGIVERAFQDEPSKFSSAEDGFDHAFNLLYGPLLAEKAEKSEPEPEAADDDNADEKAQITASTPTPPASKKRDKKASPMDAAYAAFRHLDRGGDPEDVDGARRAYRNTLSA